MLLKYYYTTRFDYHLTLSTMVLSRNNWKFKLPIILTQLLL